MKVFQQPALNTQALDKNFIRRDEPRAVSPLKYRPDLDMEGLQQEDHYKRHHLYEQARLNSHERRS